MAWHVKKQVFFAKIYLLTSYKKMLIRGRALPKQYYFIACIYHFLYISFLPTWVIVEKSEWVSEWRRKRERVRALACFKFWWNKKLFRLTEQKGGKTWEYPISRRRREENYSFCFVCQCCKSVVSTSTLFLSFFLTGAQYNNNILHCSNFFTWLAFTLEAFFFFCFFQKRKEWRRRTNTKLLTSWRSFYGDDDDDDGRKKKEDRMDEEQSVKCIINEENEEEDKKIIIITLPNHLSTFTKRIKDAEGRRN